MENKKRKLKLSKKTTGILVAFFVLVAVNLLARIEAFADFYTNHLYKYLSAPLTRLTGCVKFPVGEPLIVVAIVLTLVAIFCLVVIIIRAIFVSRDEQDENSRRVAESEQAENGAKKHSGFLWGYVKFYLAFLFLVLVLMTLNCSIPYGCSHMQLSEKTDYDIEDLIELSNMLVTKVNVMQHYVNRDEDGNPVYLGNVTYKWDENGNIVLLESDGQAITATNSATLSNAVASENYMDELYEQIDLAMNNFGEEFPRLKGYYPYPKEMLGSVFMYQTGIVGVYFPFSRESYYSRFLAPVQRPATIAHEYAHLKGYMSEDEANFIGFVSCMKSDDIFVSYSGYLNATYHVYNAAYDSVYSTLDSNGNVAYADKLIPLDEGVYRDLYSYNTVTEQAAEEASEAVEEATGVSEETVADAGDKLTETYIDYYAAVLNYDQVTALLLQYYIGEGNQ